MKNVGVFCAGLIEKWRGRAGINSEGGAKTPKIGIENERV